MLTAEVSMPVTPDTLRRCRPELAASDGQGITADRACPSAAGERLRQISLDCLGLEWTDFFSMILKTTSEIWAVYPEIELEINMKWVPRGLSSLCTQTLYFFFFQLSLPNRAWHRVQIKVFLQYPKIP